MITLPNTTYKASDISLSAILNSTTKVNMLTVLKKFDLYASPNLKKDETARRIAMEVLLPQESFGNLFRRNVKTRIIAKLARLISEDAAWATSQVFLNATIHRLVPSEESA